MKAFLLLLALLVPQFASAEDVSVTAEAQVTVTAQARTWGLSFDPFNVGLGRGTYASGWVLERAYWDHWSLVGRLDMDLGGTVGTDLYEDGIEWHTYVRLRAGTRWRPWTTKSLAGPYIGLGLAKGILADQRFILADPSDPGHNTGLGAGFRLDQYLDTYAELGWQWVRQSGLMAGVKLTLPLYADWYWGPGNVLSKLSTLSMTWGFTW